MSRTLKVTGNHVMYDRGAWFLRVIMSSSRALCCLPSVKKQKHDFQVCFVDWARHRKICSWRQGLTKHKKVDEGGKGAVCWLRETEKTERIWGIERIGTNFAKVLFRSKKEFVQCKIKQLLDSVFVLSRIIKVSVRVIRLSLRLRLITLTCTSTLIILDITKTSSIACENRRLARRNVYHSETENPYWWRKICPESGHERWLDDGVVTLF